MSKLLPLLLPAADAKAQFETEGKSLDGDTVALFVENFNAEMTRIGTVEIMAKPHAASSQTGVLMCGVHLSMVDYHAVLAALIASGYVLRTVNNIHSFIDFPRPPTPVPIPVEADDNDLVPDGFVVKSVDAENTAIEIVRADPVVADAAVAVAAEPDKVTDPFFTEPTD